MKNKLILIFLSAFLLGLLEPALACVTCNKPLAASIFDENFYRNIFYVAHPFTVLLLVAAIIYTRFNKHNYAGVALRMGPPAAAGFLIGIGMGGFLDGIIFHQILQWHQFFSAFVPPSTLLNKQFNTFWDGTFHAFTWSMTAIGIGLLWRTFLLNNVAISTSIFVGSVIGGWGVFNTYDAIVYHYLLRVHNIREITPNPYFYNHVYTAFSVLLLIIAFVLLKAGKTKITVA